MANVFIEEQTMTNIGSAIRTKKGTTDLILPEDMPEEILSIENGIDTSDATATASDMAEGVTAYVDGEKITGNVRTMGEGQCVLGHGIPTEYDDDKIAIRYTSTRPTLIRNGGQFGVTSLRSNFGTATASDVAQGVTFTSASGLKVEGELVVHDTVGSVGIASNYDKYKVGDDLYVDAFTDVDVLIRSGSGLGTTIPLSEFGDATAADVASGKTFTSESGLKINGTLPEGSPSISDGDTTCINGTSIKSGQEYKIPNTAAGTYINYTAPAVRVIYSTATITDGKIVLSNPLNVNGSSATEQKDNYSTYRYFYGDLEDGSSDSEVYRYISIKSDVGTYLTTWTYSWYHQYIDKSIYLTTTNTSDVIVRNGTSIQIYDDAKNFGNVEPSYVEEGRTFTSSSGLNIVGTGAQLLKKVTGSNNTANATTIDTGLRKIELFILYSTSASITGIGLVEAVWNGSNTSYSYCSSYTSSTNYICQYINTDSSLINVNKGVVTYNGTGEKVLKASTAWIAIGY